MRHILCVFIASLIAIGASAINYDHYFCDSTIRIDYGFNVDRHTITPSPLSMQKSNHWYGRRVNLDTIPAISSLVVNVYDTLNDLKIYSKSIQHEAAMMKGDSIATQACAVTMPLPKNDVVVELLVTGAKMDTIGLCRTHVTRQDLNNIPCTQANTPWFTVLNEAKDQSRCVNIALVAEGYTLDEMQQFREKAKEFATFMLSNAAFAPYKDRINLVSVETPSAESGISRPSKGERYNTAFNAHFDSYSLDRLMTIDDPMLLTDALQGVPCQIAIVLANTPIYGGSGPYNTYCIGYTGKGWSNYVLIHEFGHTFANLADEYEEGFSIEYKSTVEPQEPNITTLCDFSHKWQNLIDEGKAGLIEGAGYCSKGVWRGYEKCIMRTVEDKEFCPVCQQAIAQTIKYYTEQQ